MSNFFEVLMSEPKDSAAKTQATLKKVLLIIEVVAITFFFSLIPQLIALGRPPTSITEIYTEIGTALLMALYAYARIRNIDLPDGD